MPNRKKVFFKTFGCRTNQFDTQVMMSKLREFELSDDETRSDIIVVNSCHSEKEKINEILKIDKPFYQIGDLKHIDSTIVEEFVGKSRAFIKIQEGCDFRCSYCIIPAVRGDARSHREETIILQWQNCLKR